MSHPTRFSGEPCDHCGWGPATDKDLSDDLDPAIYLGMTCSQCWQIALYVIAHSHRLKVSDQHLFVEEWLERLGFYFLILE